jgi:hypothetical protein
VTPSERRYAALARLAMARQRARLHFWLAAMDVAIKVRAPRRVYLWLVGRASDATDWGSP